MIMPTFLSLLQMVHGTSVGGERDLLEGRRNREQQLKPGSSYILTLQRQAGECYLLLLLLSLN